MIKYLIDDNDIDYIKRAVEEIADLKYDLEFYIDHSYNLTDEARTSLENLVSVVSDLRLRFIDESFTKEGD